MGDAPAYSRDDFARDLRGLRMSRAQFARVTGFDPVTVYHWGYHATPFPRWVPLLVRAWQIARSLGVALPGEGQDQGK